MRQAEIESATHNAGDTRTDSSAISPARTFALPAWVSPKARKGRAELQAACRPTPMKKSADRNCWHCAWRWYGGTVKADVARQKTIRHSRWISRLQKNNVQRTF